MTSVATALRWEFNTTNSTEGWTVSGEVPGVVMGGALWISLRTAETDAAALFGRRPIELLSPRGLALETSAGQRLQMRARIRNLSPITDLYFGWVTESQTVQPGKPDAAWPENQSRRFAMQPDLDEWQEITLYANGEWAGTVDQVGITVPYRIRGDIWFDTIELLNGEPEPERFRPDLCSDAVVPQISLPDISQAGFADAFAVLDEALVTDVPIGGFPYPVISPGGGYKPWGWWMIDSSLAVAGAKWANHRFAENVMRGFSAVQAQNPDGRIDLYGFAPLRGQPADQSQLPALFPVASDIARRTADAGLREEIYTMMRRYLDWWLSPVKRDEPTGLVSGMFEETFGESQLTELQPQRIAPVDLNVAVAVGAHCTVDLARTLGHLDDATRYERAFEELTRAINEYLWDEDDGAYYNYDLCERERRRRLIVTTFDPLRLAIAPPGRRERLLERLLDPAQFNWGTLPLTSLSRTEADYVEAAGVYDGRAWWGDVWTMRNMTVVEGLEDSGEPVLAAELAWATITAFHENYHEYVTPSAGEGHGVARYAWSASQYIAAIVDHLFGIGFDRTRNRLTVKPYVPQRLWGQNLSIANLLLPTEEGSRLSVQVNQTSGEEARIEVETVGVPENVQLQVALPTSGREVAVIAAGRVEVSFP